MKKISFCLMALAMAASTMFTSCGDDDEEDNTPVKIMDLSATCGSEEFSTSAAGFYQSSKKADETGTSVLSQIFTSNSNGDGSTTIAGTAKGKQLAINVNGTKTGTYQHSVASNQTINNASYASEQDWILVGDFNAVSRLDDGVYGYGAGDKRYLAQNVILDKTNLKDIIATWYPAPQFVQSTYGVDRRDFVYLSPALVQNVVRAVTFTDSFTPGTKTGISNFSIPSDHRPFIIDFNL